MSVLNLSSASSSTPPPPSPAVGPLLPEYTFLAHCIHHSLNKARRPSSSATASSSSPPRSTPTLSLDVSSLVAAFLWQPRTTATANHLPTRSRYLAGHPALPHCTGEAHADTQQTDCWTAALAERVLSGWRLRAVTGWSGLYANGLGFAYGPAGASEGEEGDAVWEVEAVYGNHHSPQPSRFELEAGERVVQVSVVCSTWMQAVRLNTSHGRQYQLGRGEHQRYWQPLLPAPDKLHGRQVEVLAFMLGVGGHIHNVGAWYQLLSPPASERTYACVETLVAMLGRNNSESHAAAGSPSAAADEARPGSRWQREFQLGRAKRQRRTGRGQDNDDAKS